MITAEHINACRESWLKASHALGFEIITPYQIETGEGKKEMFAFLPDFGSERGVAVGLISPPEYETDDQIKKWANERDMYWSQVNVELFTPYNEAEFIDTLNDWGYFGDVNRKPVWYQ